MVLKLILKLVEPISSNLIEDVVINDNTLLSNSPDILFITKKTEYVVHNFDANLYAQSATALNINDDPSNINPSIVTPFHFNGIKGQNQIVGVGDSGLDVNHCYFSDSNETFVPLTGQTVESLTHRKVIQYVGDRDGGFRTNSHGTHVAGSVGGIPELPTTTIHNGVATDAKIAFFDIGDV